MNLSSMLMFITGIVIGVLGQENGEGEETPAEEKPPTGEAPAEGETPKNETDGGKPKGPFDDFFPDWPDLKKWFDDFSSSGPDFNFSSSGPTFNFSMESFSFESNSKSAEGGSDKDDRKETREETDAEGEGEAADGDLAPVARTKGGCHSGRCRGGGGHHGRGDGGYGGGRRRHDGGEAGHRGGRGGGHDGGGGGRGGSRPSGRCREGGGRCNRCRSGCNTKEDSNSTNNVISTISPAAISAPTHLNSTDLVLTSPPLAISGSTTEASANTKLNISDNLV